MGNVIGFPGAQSSSGGDGGNLGSMLEFRVARLEESVGEMRSDIREMRSEIRELGNRVGRIEERLARMEGGFEALHHRFNALPTVWTFTVALVAAVIGSVGLALAVTQLTQP
jgi:hypothetical protein